MASLLSDFLSVLGVRHTQEYTDRRFAAMPFQTMFGLTNILKEYGVGTTGLIVPENSRAQAMAMLTKPFLADTPDGFLIITEVAGDAVTYRTQSKFYTAPVGEVAKAWTGVTLIAQVADHSGEPDYSRHRFGELVQGVKVYILSAIVLALVGFAMWTSGLYARWSAWLLLFFNMAGMWFSWSLVQKSLGIHTAAADAVCSALEEGGCDTIAQSEASSFMGIFKWSEVGMSYFTVSLLAMLLFPATLPVLAAINILCLPYTVWSIWYQRFKAKTWCTLCVSVQCTLWLLFATYLLGGWTKQIFPLEPQTVLTFIVLGCIYAGGVLGLNRLDNALTKYLKTTDNETILQ